MPNRVHFLLYFNEGVQPLNIIIGNGKRFIGYEIVKRLQAPKQHSVLSLLAEMSSVQKKRGKHHELWQGTFDVKECRTEKFVLQKLIYMQENPCAERRKPCAKPYHYEHSSAAFYDLGAKGKAGVKDCRDFLAALLEEEQIVTDASKAIAQGYDETHRGREGHNETQTERAPPCAQWVKAGSAFFSATGPLFEASAIFLCQYT